MQCPQGSNREPSLARWGEGHGRGEALGNAPPKNPAAYGTWNGGRVVVGTGETRLRPSSETAREADPGCHPTTLTVFRARLVLHDLDRQLFTDVVRTAADAGLLAKNAVELVDASAILGAGVVQDTYTLLRKALSRVVRAGQQHLPAALRPRLE